VADTLAGRRTRIVALLAGVALFVGAMLLGMAWFGGDDDTTSPPGTDGTGTASSTPTPGDD
jgi:serine/threonine-protein kinase